MMTDWEKFQKNTRSDIKSIQVFKYSSTQLFKYSSIQVFKFISLLFNKMILLINNVKARDPVESKNVIYWKRPTFQNLNYFVNILH